MFGHCSEMTPGKANSLGRQVMSAEDYQANDNKQGSGLITSRQHPVNKKSGM